MRFGLHLSSAGKLENSISAAIKLKSDIFQIFIGNPRAWKPKDLNNEVVENFKSAFNKSNLNGFVIHMPYLPNFATPDIYAFKKSVDVLKKNLEFSNKLNAKFLVMHPGSSLGADLYVSLEKVANAINIVLSNCIGNTKLLIENTSCQGTEVGFTFKQLGFIISKVKCNNRIGVCLDTAHAFAAGYDFNNNTGYNNMLNEIRKYIGLDKILLIHLNDSKSKCGYGIDRHNHLGKGNIGLDGLKNLLNTKEFNEIDCILETPKNYPEADIDNLAIARKLLTSV